MFDVKSFCEARDVADAINALVKDPDAEIIGSDTDVLIRVREGKDTGGSIVPIHNMEALRGVRLLDNGGLWVGAGTTFSHIINDAPIQKYMPMLGDAIDMMGEPQIRSIETTDGNICNDATSTGSASTMRTLEVDVLLEGPEGKRTVSVCEFCTSPGRAVRQRTEVCAGFLIYKGGIEGWSGHYIKCSKRRAMEIATLGCMVHVKLNQDREQIEDVRLGYGVAGPTLLCCCEAEHGLKGRTVDDREAILAFGKAALEEVGPRSSWRASKEFRLQLIGELSKRVLAEAIKKTGGAVST